MRSHVSFLRKNLDLIIRENYITLKLRFRATSMPTRRYVEENSSAIMLAAKRSVGVTAEVNFREHVTRMPLPNVNKAAHTLVLKPREDITRRLKQGFQWAHRKNLSPPKKL